MTDTAIRVENLRKRYRVGPRQHYRVLRDSIASALRAPLRRLAGEGSGQPRGDFIWALDGVSFEVRQGEIVGVIGRNGAGKSTLLKILSRITEPTEGYAELHGRVGSLLEVGTGFHPELTGRENVYLNGAILGMSRAEIDRKLLEIVEFSGISRFLDTPLKYYSSGMAVRLGFAVAAHLEPEILIVDEVLAVGDVAFQQRCIGKMQEVAGGGRTVLFVSHNMRAVASLCPQSIWLDAGKIVFEGRSEEAIARYVEASRAGMSSLAERTERRGSGALRIVAARIEDGDGNPSDTVRTGEPVRFVLDYENNGSADLSTLQVNIVLSSGGGRGIVSFLSDTSGAEFGGAPRRGRLVCSVPELPLAPGLYDLQFSCLLGRVLADKVPQAGSLVVTEGDFFGTGRLPGDVDYYGPVLVRHAWSVEPSPEAGEERA